MKYNKKYNLFVDDDLVIYRWDKRQDKLVQVKPHKHSGGYLYLHTKVGSSRAHRVIWETFKGEIPDGYEIDHINNIRDDNRLENLRCVTHKENMNNPLTRKHIIGRTWSEFGEKFKKHFGINFYENTKLYRKEQMWYRRHKKCSWE